MSEIKYKYNVKLKGLTYIHWLYWMTLISSPPKPQCVVQLKTCESKLSWIWIKCNAPNFFYWCVIN